MKRFLLLAAALLLVLPLAAAARADTDGTGRFDYIVKADGTAAVTAYLAADDPCVIPEELDGYRVTELDGCVSFSQKTYNASFDTWMQTYIGTVEIPATVTRLSVYPEGAAVGRTPFVGVFYIRVAEGNPAYYDVDGVLFDRETDALLAYLRSDARETYAVPEGAKEIADGAFLGGRELKEIILPQSLTGIGAYAFYRNGALEEITIPAGVERIGEFAFPGGYVHAALRYVHVSPDNPYYCDADGVLISRQDRKLIYYPAGRPEETYAVPEGVAIIGSQAFGGARTLHRIDVPEGVEEIEAGAFMVGNLLNADGSRYGGDLIISLPRSVAMISGRMATKDMQYRYLFVVFPGSYAEAYCLQHGLRVEYAENTGETP